MANNRQSDIPSQHQARRTAASFALGQPDIRQFGQIRRALRSHPPVSIVHREAQRQAKQKALAQNVRRIVPNPIRNVNFSMVFTSANNPVLAVPTNTNRRRLFILPQLISSVISFWFFDPATPTSPGAIVWNVNVPFPVIERYEENGTNISTDSIYVSSDTAGDTLTIYEGVDL